MSNVADLKLCEDLYELSEWDDTEFVYYIDREAHIVEHRSKIVAAERLPAYDCGYLLESLPKTIDWPGEVGELWLVLNADKTGKYGRGWIASYVAGPMDGDFHEYVELGDTPEDALCALAIELAKQGLLESRKEQDGE